MQTGANRGELVGTNTDTSRFSRRRNSRHVRRLRNRGNGLEIKCRETGNSFSDVFPGAAAPRGNGVLAENGPVDVFAEIFDAAVRSGYSPLQGESQFRRDLISFGSTSDSHEH
jgi:hypothetical protein